MTLFSFPSITIVVLNMVSLIIDQIRISSQDLLGVFTNHHLSCINTPLVLLRIKNDSCLLRGAVMEFPCLGIEGVHIWFSVACWEQQLGGHWPQ